MRGGSRNSRQSPNEPGQPHDSIPPKPRLDLEAAVSQITSRRQALDAREARSAFAAPRADPATDRTDANGEVCSSSATAWPSGRRETGVPVKEGARVPVNTRYEARREPTRSPPAPPELPREDIRAPASRLDGAWRERADQRVGDADLAAMREQIAAMARILSDLAPRNAVVALEGAVRDLTERVAMLREDGCRELLLAPLDHVAAELRSTFKSHNPQAVAAGLEREIRALGGKIDRLAHAAINPETFERIRRQTEEVRNLLAAAATRTAPVERLERQISELADRVERLGASPAPHVESAQMAASLACVREEIERAAPLSTLLSIERRLEQIAARLDQEIGRSAQDGVDQRPFDELARRIDGVRQSVETRPQPQFDTSGMQALLVELSAKLAGPNAESLMTLMRDISDKLDAVSLNRAEASASEPTLTEIIGKLDRLPRPEAFASRADMRSLEQTLQSLQAKLGLGDGWTFDRQVVSQIVEEVSHRVENSAAARIDAQGLADQIARIHNRLEALSGRFSSANALESVMRELLEKLAEGAPSSIAGGTGASSEVSASLAGELAELKAERATGDNRIQLRLTEIHHILQTLAAHLASVEAEHASTVDDELPSPPTPLRPAVSSLGGFRTPAQACSPASAPAPRPASETLHKRRSNS